MDVKNKIIINRVPFTITENPHGGIILLTRDTNLVGCGKNSMMEFMGDHSSDLPHFEIGTVSVSFHFNQTIEKVIRMLESAKDKDGNKRFEIKQMGREGQK